MPSPIWTLRATVSFPRNEPTLADLGISKNQSSR
jgi:hypothetical protein